MDGYAAYGIWFQKANKIRFSPLSILVLPRALTERRTARLFYPRLLSLQVDVE
ncbi:hypothetical protein ABIB44_001484 [Hymenobacter sp. UYCo722]